MAGKAGFSDLERSLGIATYALNAREIAQICFSDLERSLDIATPGEQRTRYSSLRFSDLERSLGIATRSLVCCLYMSVVFQ